MAKQGNEIWIEIGKVAGSIGKGLFAGLVGTAAITASQMVEMALEDRGPSSIPADVASRVFGVEPVNEEEKSKLAQEVHWAYGTSWGAFRGLLSVLGIKGWAATALHFVAVWGTAIPVQTRLAGAPPVRQWEPKTIAMGGFHHAVYAITAGAVYEAIDNRGE